MSRSHSDADLLTAIRTAASEASSAVPSVVGSRHGRSSHRRRTGSAASLRSQSYTSGSRTYSRGGTGLSRASTSGGPLCMTLEENQQSVQDSAHDRFIRDLEKEAKEAVTDLHGWRTTVSQGLDEETNERRRRKQREEENQSLLKHQMESNKARRAEGRREYIQNASAHSFPLFTETFIDVDEFERIRKEQKVTWRAELDQQKVTNDMLRNLEEKKVRDMAEQNHKQNLHSMTRDRSLEYDRLAKQGKELVKSWDRDVHIKTLKKAMSTGRDVSQEVGLNRTGYIRR